MIPVSTEEMPRRAPSAASVVATMSSRTIAVARDDADTARDAERAFTDTLLDAVGQAVEDLDHEVGNLRSVGREDDARAIETAMRPLRAVQSGVEPVG